MILDLISVENIVIGIPNARICRSDRSMRYLLSTSMKFRLLVAAFAVIQIMSCDCLWKPESFCVSLVKEGVTLTSSSVTFYREDKNQRGEDKNLDSDDYEEGEKDDNKYSLYGLSWTK